MVLILMPGIGVLSWREFEQNLGWSNFFVIAASLSLAAALVSTGAAAWFADLLVGGAARWPEQPLLTLLALCGGFAAVRLVLTNIAAYLSLVVPIAMTSAAALGLNPLVCGMAAVVVGDSVVYYSAAGTGAVFIFQRAEIGNLEILRFGLIMTAVAIAVLFGLALPYWGLVGQPLTP